MSSLPPPVILQQGQTIGQPSAPPRPISVIVIENLGGDQAIPLEYVCPQCKGAREPVLENGKTVIDPATVDPSRPDNSGFPKMKPVKCDACQNLGTRPSIAGQRILDFVKKYTNKKG
jgi:hypothetical protein